MLWNYWSYKLKQQNRWLKQPKKKRIRTIEMKDIRLDLDVKQNVMAFLAFHAHLKSTLQGKKALIEIMGPGVGISWILVGWSETAFWVIATALPWGTLENGEFLYLGPENCNFAVYNNFCFFNNFLLKSQNKVLLVLRLLLRSTVYDSAFNLIFPFLVNFGILSCNRIISAN